MKLLSFLKILINPFMLLIWAQIEEDLLMSDMSKQYCWQNKKSDMEDIRPIRPIHYNLKLDIDMKRKTFYGKLKLEILPIGNVIGLINAYNLTIYQIIFNNKQNLGFIYDNINTLKINFNYTIPVIKDHNVTLTIIYTGYFQSVPRGLHKYSIYDIDEYTPVTIILSKIFPAYAHFIFPCINEPNYLTTFSLQINLTNGENYIPVFNSACKDKISLSELSDLYVFEKTIQLPLHALTINIVFNKKTFTMSFPEMNITMISMKKFKYESFFRTKVTERAIKQKIQHFIHYIRNYIRFLQSRYLIPVIPTSFSIVLLNGFQKLTISGWGCLTLHFSNMKICDLVSLKCKEKIFKMLHPITKMFFGMYVTLKEWDYHHLLEALAVLVTFQYVEWHSKSITAAWFYNMFSYKILYLTSKINVKPVLENNICTFEATMNFLTENMYTYKIVSLIVMFRFELEFFNQNIGGQCLLKSRLFDLNQFYHCLFIMNSKSKDWFDGWLKKRNFPMVYVRHKPDNSYVCSTTYYSHSFDNNIQDPQCGHEFPIEFVLYDNNTLVHTLIGIIGPEICRHTVEVDKKSIIKANYLGRGFYRTAYSEEIYEGLTKNFLAFGERDKSNYVADIFTMANVGVISFKYVFELIKMFSEVKEEIPWTIFAKQVTYISRRLVPVTDTFNAFNKFITTYIKTNINETDNLRNSVVFPMLCELEVQECTNWAQEKLKNFLNNPSAIFNSNAKELIFTYGIGSIETNKRDVVSELWDLCYLEGLEIETIRKSLLKIKNSLLLQEIVNNLFDKQFFDEAELVDLLTLVGRNRYGYFLVWRLLMEKTDILLQKITVSELGMIINGIEQTHFQKYLLPKEKLKKFYKRFEHNDVIREVKARSEEHIQFNLDWLDKRENDLRKQLGLQERSSGSCLPKNIFLFILLLNLI